MSAGIWFTLKYFDTHAHTTVLWCSWILTGSTMEGNTNLVLLEEEKASGRGISWAICKSAP